MSEISVLIEKLSHAATNYGINQFTNPILAQRYHSEMLELELQLNDAIEVFGTERYSEGHADAVYYAAVGDH